MASRQCNSALVLLVLCVGAASSSAQAPGVSAAAGTKIVALNQGSCVSVASGDLVTFTWNPGFTPAVSSEVREMTLMFGRPGAALAKIGPPEGGFALHALNGKPRLGAAEPIVDGNNGFLLFTFRAELSNVHPGQYTLVDARATPEIRTGAAGEPPVMTNNPKTSYFCLEVTSSPTGKR